MKTKDGLFISTTTTTTLSSLLRRAERRTGTDRTSGRSLETIVTLLLLSSESIHGTLYASLPPRSVRYRLRWRKRRHRTAGGRRISRFSVLLSGGGGGGGGTHHGRDVRVRVRRDEKDAGKAPDAIRRLR